MAMVEETKRELGLLQHRWPGVCIWWGATTRNWWAALPKELISAETPRELDEAIRARRSWTF